MITGLIITVIALLMVAGGFTLFSIGLRDIKSPKQPLVLLGIFLVIFSLFPIAMAIEFYSSYYGRISYGHKTIEVGSKASLGSSSSTTKWSV